MGYSKEQRIVNSVSGSTKKKRNEKKSSNVADGFILPNYSSAAGAEKIDGKLNSLKIVGDLSSTDTEGVVMILYNTDETPPTASNYPTGTIYVQYSE